MSEKISGMDPGSAMVLVVDDEEVMRRSLTDILRLDGYHVENAPNAHEAIKTLQQTTFDVILLDLRMPIPASDLEPKIPTYQGMTDEQAGMSVLRYVAEHAPDTQVIILTAHGSMDTAITALRLSALDYLLKPMDPAEILTAVKKALLRRQEVLRTRTQEAALNSAKTITQQIGQSLSSLGTSFQALRAIAESDTDPSSVISASAENNLELPNGTEGSRLQSPTIIYQLKPGLMIDLLRREIWQTIDENTEAGQRKIVTRLSLTPTEGKLMQVFAENIGKVIPHKELVIYVQGTDTIEMEAPEVLRPFISRLRRKLGVFPHGRSWIRSIRGTGYIFDPDLEK